MTQRSDRDAKQDLLAQKITLIVSRIAALISLFMAFLMMQHGLAFMAGFDIAMALIFFLVGARR